MNGIKNIIVIMLNLPLEWSTDYNYQTAIELSKKNIVVFYDLTETYSLKEYVQKRTVPILWKRLESNIFVYSPVYIVPFRRSPFVTNLNNSLSILILRTLLNLLFQGNHIGKKILWVFNPQFYSDMYRSFRGFFLVYDCVDYFRGNMMDTESRRNIEEQENKLLQNADAVFTISHTLKSLHTNVRKDICIVPQGFRADTFNSYRRRNRNINEPQKPTIGYIGGINYRIDYPLLIKIATLCPRYQFVFVGPIRNDNAYFRDTCLPHFLQLLRLPNVTYIPEINKKNIPSIVNSFSIGIIPYNTQIDFNKYCYPMKLFEYFYLGKPVVSAPIEELRRFPDFVFTASTSAAWKNTFDRLLKKPWPASYKLSQKKISLNNSWSEKIASISKKLTELNVYI